MARKSKIEPEPKVKEVVEEQEEEESEDEEVSEEEGSEEEGSEEESASEEEEEVEEEEEEEEEEDLSNRETLLKLLEPFGKDQLIDLLKDAATRNPTLLARISESAESDPAHRKIFVGGLGWDCTTETLAAAFRPYGEVEECRAITDRATNRCKGYGFVLFKTRRGAHKALKEPQKHIGGRLTSCQLASKGSAMSASPAASWHPKVPGPSLLAMPPAAVNPLPPAAVNPLPSNDHSFTYASGSGLLNPATGLLGQGFGVQSGGGGVGLLNPTAGILPTVNRSVAGSSYGAGMGVNTVSPSVIGSYQSLAALQGLGASQSSQTMNPGMRNQSSLESSGSGLPSHLWR